MLKVGEVRVRKSARLQMSPDVPSQTRRDGQWLAMLQGLGVVLCVVESSPPVLTKAAVRGWPGDYNWWSSVVKVTSQGVAL